MSSVLLEFHGGMGRCHALRGCAGRGCAGRARDGAYISNREFRVISFIAYLRNRGTAYAARACAARGFAVTRLLERQPLTFTGTLNLARRRQPDAERVILIGGAAAMDSLRFSRAIRDLTPLLGNWSLVTMQDWMYPSLLSELRPLPARSIGILIVSRDQAGQRFSSGDLIASVTHASAVPLQESRAIGWATAS